MTRRENPYHIVCRLLPEIKNRLRRLLPPLLVGCASASGCGDSSLTEVPSAQIPQLVVEAPMSMTGEGVRGDDVDEPPVTARWFLARTAEAEVFSDSIFAEIDDTWGGPVTVDLALLGMGLDRRVAMTPVGQFYLAANEKTYVEIGIAELPVQSIGAPSQVDLVAVSSGPTWTDNATPTDSVYLQFSEDYTHAYISTESSWAVTALALVQGDRSLPQYAGLLEEPLSAEEQQLGDANNGASEEVQSRMMYEKVLIPWMMPRGKYLDESANWVEVLGDGRIGGSMIGMKQRSRVV